MDAGKRDKRISFQRNGAARSALGGKATPAWSELFKRWAAVRYGTGAERRAAAGEQAVQSATFIVLADSETKAITAKDRIVADGLSWDISGIALLGRSDLEFTATASRD